MRSLTYRRPTDGRVEVGGCNPGPKVICATCACDDIAARVQMARGSDRPVAGRVLVDPLPGGCRADHHRDAHRQPGAEHVLQYLWGHRRLNPRSDRSIHLPAGIPSRDRFPLVVLALAFGQTDLQLDPVSLPVEP